MRWRGGCCGADLHFHAGDAHAEQCDDGPERRADDREDDRDDDDGWNRRERPFDDDCNHTPERNVDIDDRDPMRRGRRLNGHRCPPGCARPHGWPKCRNPQWGSLMRKVDLATEPREEWRKGVLTCMRVSAANGGTQLCLFEQWCEPGHGAPTHLHADRKSVVEG